MDYLKLFGKLAKLFENYFYICLILSVWQENYLKLFFGYFDTMTEPFRRITPEENQQRREVYYGNPLFVTFCDAIEQFETRLNGLTPVEVWDEVLRITQELLTSKRPDKLISSIYTGLIARYRCLVMPSGQWMYERDDFSAAASAVVVLTCVMFYILQPKNLPEKNRKIAQQIRLCFEDPVKGVNPLFVILFRLQRQAEQEEEDADNPVPDVNPLQDRSQEASPSKPNKLYRKMSQVCFFFTVRLEMAHYVDLYYLETEEREENRFWSLFEAVLQDEELLMLLARPTLNMKTLKDGDKLLKSKEKCEQLAAEGNYNVKFFCNLMGILKEQGVLIAPCNKLSELFFTDNKTVYFQPSRYKEFGSSSSAFATQAVYERLLGIVKNHVKKT